MKRKQLTQSQIDKTQRWCNRHVAARRESLTKEGSAEYAWGLDRLTAFRMYQRPEWLKKFSDDFETQKLTYVMTNPGVLICELAALHLEQGQPLPQPLRKFVAEVLRTASKTFARGNLSFRNGEIAILLIELEKAGLPLFPNSRDGRKKGQTYACDIVVEAFKKAGIPMSVATIEGTWKRASCLPHVLTARKRNTEFSKIEFP